MESGKEMICKKGDVIFRERSYGSSIFRVIAGKAAVYANYGGEDEKLLTELREGDYFGEMAVIEITQRSATVVAAEDGTRLAEIDASDLGGYLERHPGEINALARHLSRRLRELTGDYTEVCDTLRELGRLDTSRDKTNDGLMARIKKFAMVYLAGQKPEAELAEPVAYTKAQKCDKSLAVRAEEYRAGDLIFREGDRSDCMYYIHEGRVGIYTGYGTAKQKLLTELTPEMFFGEMGLFEGANRTAAAVALEKDTCVELIRESDLNAIFKNNPAMALMVLQHLSSRLRRLTNDYLKACKTLAETQRDIEEANAALTPEARLQAEYMNQLLLAPELLY